MQKTTLSRNMAQLSALFAIVLISASVMGAGCSSSAEIKADIDNTPKTGESMDGGTTESSNDDSNTGVEIETKTPTPTAPTTTVMTATKTPAPSTKPTSANAYKDGTYSADGTYNSPAGAEHLPVSLTLKSDMVTDAKVSVVATNPKSKYMQEQFAAGFKQYVVGKKLNDVNVGKVSGSSLTGIGFNDAVTKIKAQAAVK